MTDRQFNVAFFAALRADNRDAYISDYALSSLFTDADDDAEISRELIDQLGHIWDVAHTSVRDIRAHMGLTQAKFAEHFLVPKRTVENWEGEKNKCPDYLRVLMAEDAGMFKRT